MEDDPKLKLAITPTLDLHTPEPLIRRRSLWGYAEMIKYTGLVKSMITEGRLLHTGEEMLAEHVNRATLVKANGAVVLSSQKSPGPIEVRKVSCGSCIFGVSPGSIRSGNDGFSKVVAFATSLCETPRVGFFTPKVTTAQMASAPVKAASGRAALPNQRLLDVLNSASQQRALQNPTVSRSKDLLASMIGCLEMRHYSKQWTGERYEEIYLPLEPWMEQPDPKVTRNFFYSNIFSDLVLLWPRFCFCNFALLDRLASKFFMAPSLNGVNAKSVRPTVVRPFRCCAVQRR
jgi:hypothetical protein